MNGVAMKRTRMSPSRFKFAPSDLITTRSLVLYMESTGRDGDCNSFGVRKSSRGSTPSDHYSILPQVAQAFIGETAKVLQSMPGYDDTAVNPPGLELPRFRCFFYFQDQDPTKPDHCRIQGWCLENIQILWYDIDKEYSRAASKLAIPQLLDEINIIRDPLQAEKRFRHLVVDLDLDWARRRTTNAAGDDVELEPLEEYFERLRILTAEHGGYGP